jgi:hypothetical protein
LIILLQTPKHLYKRTFYGFTYAFCIQDHFIVSDMPYLVSLSTVIVSKIFFAQPSLSNRGSYTLLALQNTKQIVQLEIICQRGCIYSSLQTMNQIDGSVRITYHITGS